MAKCIIIVISCALGCGLLMLLCRQPEYSPNSYSVHINESYQSTTNKATVEAAYESSSMGIELNSTRNHILLLHRKKRYLLFPEGSSFQLVFDLIIPIVDYTNFAILGITCAVAWELPSKPPSEILDNLRTRLNDGTLGTVRRNDSVQEVAGHRPLDNGDYIRTATNWQSMHAQPTSAAAPAVAASPFTSTYAVPSGNAAHSYSSYSSYYTNVRQGGSYDGVRVGDTSSAYANAPNGGQQQAAHAPASAPAPAPGRPTNWHARQSIAKWQQWAQTTRAPPARMAAPDLSDNWWQRNKARVQQNWHEKQQQWSTYEATTNRYNYDYTQRPRQVLQAAPTHHIYPVFGKRRRRRESSNDDVIERMHLRQHLSSRGLLFAKIERLYRTRQLNGTACIQRALCESAQRQQLGGRPQSFIMELLSAIFQLPSSEDSEEALPHIASHYLEAHRERGNCRQLFGECQHNFWFQ